MAGEMTVDLSSSCITSMTDESQRIHTKNKIELCSPADKELIEFPSGQIFNCRNKLVTEWLHGNSTCDMNATIFEPLLC